MGGNMTGTTCKSAGGRALAVFALTAAIFAGSRATVGADAETSLVGTWAVQVTLRDCTTNAPIGAPFNSLVTFHHDGTLSESAGSVAFAPGQRGYGHGSWTRRRGHTYRQEMIALVLVDTPLFFAGWPNVSHTLRFTDQDHIASAGTNAFYKASGELYRSGCSTATAQRF